MEGFGLDVEIKCHVIAELVEVKLVEVKEHQGRVFLLCSASMHLFICPMH